MKGVVVSQHAATRYMERVKPALDFAAARTELERLVEMCPALVPEVDWLPGDDYGINVGYLEVAPGIACPVLRAEGGTLIATTCCTYGSLSEASRREANVAKREQRRRRRKKKPGGRPVLEVES